MKADPNRIAALEIETQGRVLTVDIADLSPEMREMANTAEMFYELGMTDG